MAFNPAPTLFFGTAYSANSTAITIPVAAFPELSAAEANSVSGDSRRMIWALIDKLCSTFQALPAEDRPTKMTLTRGYGSIDAATGDFTATYSMTFSLNADIAGITREVIAE